MRQQSSGGQSRHPSFEPISEIDFLRVPEVTRRRAKLEDLNQLFIYLWRRATTGGQMLSCIECDSFCANCVLLLR